MTARRPSSRSRFSSPAPTRSAPPTRCSPRRPPPWTGPRMHAEARTRPSRRRRGKRSAESAAARGIRRARPAQPRAARRCRADERAAPRGKAAAAPAGLTRSAAPRRDAPRREPEPKSEDASRAVGFSRPRPGLPPAARQAAEGRGRRLISLAFPLRLRGALLPGGRIGEAGPAQPAHRDRPAPPPAANGRTSPRSGRPSGSGTAASRPP